MSKRIKMRERHAKERSKDFSQVNMGYSRQEALEEAKRCIQCKKPLCVEGCPVEIDIPAFIKAIADDNPLKAAEILKEKNNLPAVCGRVCPQEEQCEKKCILGKKGAPVGIGHLERFAADFEKDNASSDESKEKKHEVNIVSKGRIAVVGFWAGGFDMRRRSGQDGI